MSGSARQESSAGAATLAAGYVPYSVPPKTQDAAGFYESKFGSKLSDASGSSGKSADELLAEKHKNAGLNPDGTSGTSGAPQVTLPAAPTLPAVNLPAAPGLPTYTSPGTPPALPALSAPAAAPVEGSTATNAARVRVTDSITARRGRQSTFLTTPDGRTSATPMEAPKPPMARRATGAGVFGGEIVSGPPSQPQTPAAPQTPGQLPGWETGLPGPIQVEGTSAASSDVTQIPGVSTVTLNPDTGQLSDVGTAGGSTSGQTIIDGNIYNSSGVLIGQTSGAGSTGGTTSGQTIIGNNIYNSSGVLIGQTSGAGSTGETQIPGVSTVTLNPDTGQLSDTGGVTYVNGVRYIGGKPDPLLYRVNADGSLAKITPGINPYMSPQARNKVFGS
jgi:hypothetical protein